MIYDLMDPLRINRDVFNGSNNAFAVIAAFLRLGFHGFSIWMFFKGSKFYNRDFARVAPFGYCDAGTENFFDLVRRKPRALERFKVNPSWQPYNSNMKLSPDGGFITSPFSILMQDLKCLPRGYSKADIAIAAAIDIFFLPMEWWVLQWTQTIADFSAVLFLFFISEEFFFASWIATTTRNALTKLYTFVPVYIGIAVGASWILAQRFGLYFTQFKNFRNAFMNVFNWGFGTPKHQLDDDVDLLKDNQSWVLACYFIIISFMVLVLASNIFISIVLDAYTEATEEGLKKNYKYARLVYYTHRQNQNGFLEDSKSRRLSGWMFSIFPNIKQAFSKQKVNDALERIKDETK